MLSQCFRSIVFVAAMLVSICWVAKTSSRVEQLEYRVMMLEGQGLAQQGLVEGMYLDKAAEDDPTSRLETLEEQVEAIQGAIAALIYEASLRISPKE